MNAFLTVRWRMAIAFFLVIFALLCATGLYLLDWTERYYIKSISGDLRRESRAIAGLMQTTGTALPDLVSRVGNDLGHRITVIRSDGVVLADSQHDHRTMPNHANRPEIRKALALGYGTSTRYSATLKTRMMYVATSYGSERRPVGVVRVSEPLSGLDHIMRTIQSTFLLAGLVAMVVAAVVSLKLASSVTRPIANISAAARRLASGDLGARVAAKPDTKGELGALASTFNAMAEQLQETIQQTTEREAQMQAIFDRTDDGLLLYDNAIRRINPAACRMLGVDCAGATGKTIIEATLSHDLAALVDRVMHTGEAAALDLELTAGVSCSSARSKEAGAVAQTGVTAHAYVTRVLGDQPERGALIVLHDVTAARKLDQVRRDFVANVSHELRTPLSSIKAMAETILLRGKGEPQAVRFASGIVQEVDRMKLLADDLLELERAESQRRTADISNVHLAAVVDGVFARVQPSAEKKRIELVNDVSALPAIRSDADILGQILCNLIDNAIKYTGEGGIVTISAEVASGHVDISVADNGIGIPEEHLARIFERFYRVDKARSKESGGTGLGLSIVKHLTELLGGSISVLSEPGKGSVFRLRLPTE